MAGHVNDLGRDPVGPLLARLAVPAVMAQLVNALYNIVDRMFIGHMAGSGGVALTGLGVCFPVLMFISALSSLVGSGGGARAAIAMGEGDQKKAEAILGSSTALLLLVSLVVTPLFQLIKTPMLLAFGGSAATLPYASAYLTIYLWGTVSVQLALGLNTFIATQGFSTVSMGTVLIGAVINLVLDPVFIFGLNMGVEGAALATILAQTVSALWVLKFLTGKRTRLKLRLRLLRLSPGILAPVVAIGVSPFIMQATESLVTVAFNASLQKYGGDDWVGAMTICASAFQVLIMPLNGLGQAAQPITGFNYGARQTSRVRECFRLLLKISVLWAVCACALLELFPGVFIAIFSDNPALTEVTRTAMRIYAAGSFAMGVQFSCQQTFVALGQAKISLFLACLRKLILLIPFIFIFPLLLGNTALGAACAVLLAEPAADILAASTTGILFSRRFPRILREREEG